MALRVVHGAALKEHVGHSKRRFGRPLGRPASAPPRRPVERETLPVSLGVPLGWPQRSGGQAPEADALSTELQAREGRSYGSTAGGTSMATPTRWDPDEL